MGRASFWVHFLPLPLRDIDGYEGSPVPDAVHLPAQNFRRQFEEVPADDFEPAFQTLEISALKKRILASGEESL